MKKIGSVLLMFGLVCFLGGIVGCPATPPKAKVVTPPTTTTDTAPMPAKDGVAPAPKDGKKTDEKVGGK